MNVNKTLYYRRGPVEVNVRYMASDDFYGDGPGIEIQHEMLSDANTLCLSRESALMLIKMIEIALEQGPK